jgi:hypothetical protein
MSTTSEFLRHAINEGSFGRSKCQQTGSRLRELGLFPAREELTSQTAAALLFALTFSSQSELVGAVTNRRKDFDETTESLGTILSEPETLANLQNIEFYATGLTARFNDHSHFSGTTSKSEILTKTEISGDWLRLFSLAMQSDHFIGNSF